MFRSIRLCCGPLCLLTVLGLLSATPTSAGDCSGRSAFVAISSANYSSQQVLADGTWSVSGGADAVHLRYYVGSTLYQSEAKSGTAGSWSFIDDFSQCGSHTFKACAAPKECDGGCTICWEHETCKTKSFTSTSCSLSMSSLSCSWSCSGPAIFGAPCTGSCSVTASGGVSPYHADWKINGSLEHVQTSSTGTFNLSFIECLSADEVRVEVEDDNGGTGTKTTVCGF